MLDAVAPEGEEQRTRVLSGGLPWPAVRGDRLLRAFTSLRSAANSQNQDEEEAIASQQDPLEAQNRADFPYEIELCEPTAGHVALVLVHRPTVSTPGAALPPPVAANATATAPAEPRVVYVLDAVPPSRATSGGSNSRGSRRKKILQQQVDELDLLQELFAPATRAVGGKDGSVLAKAPLLCARFDCRVVSVRFICSGGSSQQQHPNPSRTNSQGKGGLSDSFRSLSSSSSSNSPPTQVVATPAPLRCVVAREDGMAYLWEWQADLYQWIFLNRFCFLENPNLKWTRPVAAFTSIDLPLSSSMNSSQGLNSSGELGSSSGPAANGATELAWWSTATKQEPKLKLRRLRFERATDALRATDVVVGSAFSPKLPCADVSELLSSKLGLFAISETAGIFFRSATASLRTVALNWDAILPPSEGSTTSDVSQLVICLHNVTGELILLHRKSGVVYLVTPKPPRSPAIRSSSNNNDEATGGALFARTMTTLTQPSATNGQDLEVLDVAAHRHTLLVRTRSMLRVHSLVTGALLDAVHLPICTSDGSQQKQQRNRQSCQFWTIAGSTSAVGLWTPQGIWTIQPPSAKVVGAALHRHPQLDQQTDTSDPEAAFLAVKDYGVSNLQLDAARYALEVLEHAMPPAMDPTQHHPEAWEAARRAVSSPALLLALLDNRATPERVVENLAQLVTVLYSTAQGIRTSGRLDGSTVTENRSEQLQRLTPANLESLHHLSNWIVLAKRKLARLEASDGGGRFSASTSVADDRRPRAVSELTTVLANEDDLSAYSGSMASLPPVRDGRQRNESVEDPEDTRNFRLSRKLRPMSSLRFAAGCSSSSATQGRQWLLQLEAFLLGNVAFKQPQQDRGDRVLRAEATPSHLLFHSERMLADFRHVAASSFSKHMYLESISRLYLLYEPSALLPFVRCVERFCPRLFSLSGHQTLARSHAERALTLFPPLQLFIDRVLQGDGGEDGQAAKASLVAYVDLLSYCGRHAEACEALLRCHLYDESKAKLLLLLKGPQDEQKAGEDEQEEESSARAAASTAVYFLLLGYRVKHRDATELQALLMLKPSHVDVLQVLRALRAVLPASSKSQRRQNGDAHGSGVTVGDLRPVLMALMRQRRAGEATK
ncbi:hypothetical protein BBJ28_00020428 [Nothophytophthora sp. Chile5]|nr:hypothetical protein BBJ28_00020428 [Nothophytophthora sp. Chile5]